MYTSEMTFLALHPWTCVSISSMKRPHVTRAPSFLHHPSTLPSPAGGSQSRRVELVTAPTQGASWLLHDDDADTQLAVGVLIPKGSQFIMHSRDNIIAHSQHDKHRSLPTDFDKPCCPSSCWSAPPTWSSTTLPWSGIKYSSLIPLLISKSTNFNSVLYANISKLSFLNKC